MSINRREAVKLLAAGGASLTFARPSRAEANDTSALYVVLDGLSPRLSIARIKLVIAQFTARAIRFGLVLRPEAFHGADSAPYAELINDLIMSRPDAFELIPFAQELGGTDSYFQRRAAYELRQSTAEFLAGQSVFQPRQLAPLTAATDASETASYGGLRSASFRQVLTIADAAPVCGASVVCMPVTQSIALVDAKPTLLTRDGQDRIVRITLEGIEPFTARTIRDRATAVAEQVWGSLHGGLVFNPLPRHRLQFLGPSQGRFVGVHLHAAQNDDQQAAYQALYNALTQAQIPFSEDDADLPLADPTFDFNLAMAQGIGAVLDARPNALPGLDAQAMHHLSVQRQDAGIEALDELGRDVMISLRPQFFMHASQRDNMVSTLLRLQRGTLTTVLTAPDYLERLAPRDPVLELLQQTRAEMPAPRRTALNANARAALLADAETAWAFVVRMTEPATGLCASTAFYDPVYPSTYHGLTMWDLGSLYFSILHAHRLGLIDDDTFLKRLQPVLAGTKAVKAAGLLLMPQEISTSRLGQYTPGFNPCDNGRLLSALHWIDRYPLSAGLTRELVESWELQAAVQDGALQAVNNNRLQPEQPSHCSQYTARALRAWGIEAELPFQTAPDTADATMRLLRDTAAIGPITTEPLLYEVLEMGDTPVSAYLTRLLYGAQLRASQASWQLFAVSEAPLDRAPWFTYQGFQIGNDIDPWSVVSPDPAAEYKTRRFRDSVRLINTKAAYLWAAVWPGDYTDRLLAEIRAKAPIDGGGFSPGVYVQSGAAMQNYTDINTNAAVLQAVSHMLHGRL